MKFYTYSKNNERNFVVPDEYDELLKNGGKSKKPKKKDGVALIVIRTVAILAFLGLGVFAASKVYSYWKDEQYSKAKQSEVLDVGGTTIVTTLRDTPAYPEYEGSEERVPGYPQVVEISKLKQLALVYPDFVGWLYIDGTTISYPTVYNKDLNYYLRRNMDGVDNLSGTLFFDNRNDVSTLKGNVTIYGHAMQNGTMFGTLKDFASKSYWAKHNMIYLYTPEEVIVYKVFAAYDTTTQNNYTRTSFSSPTQYLGFLNTLKGDSEYDTQIKLKETDDILTLSTCHYYTESNGRFVVHAVKIGSTPLQ